MNAAVQNNASSPLAGEGREGGNGGAFSGKHTARTPTSISSPQGGGESLYAPPVGALA